MIYEWTVTYLDLRQDVFRVKQETQQSIPGVLSLVDVNGVMRMIPWDMIHHVDAMPTP